MPLRQSNPLTATRTIRQILGITATVAACVALIGMAMPVQQPAPLTADWLTAELNTKQVVHLPPGRYKIDKPLPHLQPGKALIAVPGTVTFDVTFAGKPLDHTNANTAKAVLNLLGQNTVTGIDFFFPEVNPTITPSLTDTTSPNYVHKFPWCIWVGGENNFIQQCRMINGPRGILSYASQCTIRDVSGGCWWRGLVLDVCGHTYILNNIKFNEPGWAGQHDGSVGGFDEIPIIKWQMANSRAFTFQRVDALQATDLMAARHSIGILCTGSDPPFDNAAWRGSRPSGYVQGFALECGQDIVVDWTMQTGISNVWTGKTGFTFANGYLAGYPQQGQHYVKILGADEKGEGPVVTLSNIGLATLSDRYPDDAYIHAENARLTANGLYFHLSDVWERNLFLRMNKGRVNWTGGEMPGVAGKAAVILGAGVTRAAFSGVDGLEGRITKSNNSTQLRPSGLTPP